MTEHLMVRRSPVSSPLARCSVLVFKLTALIHLAFPGLACQEDATNSKRIILKVVDESGSTLAGAVVTDPQGKFIGKTNEKGRLPNPIRLKPDKPTITVKISKDSSRRYYEKRIITLDSTENRQVSIQLYSIPKYLSDKKIGKGQIGSWVKSYSAEDFERFVTRQHEVAHIDLGGSNKHSELTLGDPVDPLPDDAINTEKGSLLSIYLTNDKGPLSGATIKGRWLKNHNLGLKHLCISLKSGRCSVTIPKNTSPLDQLQLVIMKKGYASRVLVTHPSRNNKIRLQLKAGKTGMVQFLYDRYGPSKVPLQLKDLEASNHHQLYFGAKGLAVIPLRAKEETLTLRLSGPKILQRSVTIDGDSPNNSVRELHLSSKKPPKMAVGMLDFQVLTNEKVNVSSLDPTQIILQLQGLIKAELIKNDIVRLRNSNDVNRLAFRAEKTISGLLADGWTTLQTEELTHIIAPFLVINPKSIEIVISVTNQQGKLQAAAMAEVSHQAIQGELSTKVTTMVQKAWMQIPKKASIAALNSQQANLNLGWDHGLQQKQHLLEVSTPFKNTLSLEILRISHNSTIVKLPPGIDYASLNGLPVQIRQQPYTSPDFSREKKSLAVIVLDAEKKESQIPIDNPIVMLNNDWLPNKGSRMKASTVLALDKSKPVAIKVYHRNFAPTTATLPHVETKTVFISLKRPRGQLRIRSRGSPLEVYVNDTKKIGQTPLQLSGVDLSKGDKLSFRNEARNIHKQIILRNTPKILELTGIYSIQNREDLLVNIANKTKHSSNQEKLNLLRSIPRDHPDRAQAIYQLATGLLDNDYGKDEVLNAIQELIDPPLFVKLSSPAKARVLKKLAIFHTKQAENASSKGFQTSQLTLALNYLRTAEKYSTKQELFNAASEQQNLPWQKAVVSYKLWKISESQESREKAIAALSSFLGTADSSISSVQISEAKELLAKVGNYSF